MKPCHLQQHEETNKLLGKISHKERPIPYKHLMWNSKQNKQTEQETDSWYKLLGVREDQDEEMGEMGEEDGEMQTSSYKVNHRDIMLYFWGK